MKAEELRIGNLLYYKNTRDIAKVELIHNNHFYCRDEYGAFTPNGNYEPIPLTEEILLKCGFDKDRDRDSYYIDVENGYNKFDIMYFSDVVYLKSRYDGENLDVQAIPYIKYIHQLQNLYYALTGQELNIKGL